MVNMQVIHDLQSLINCFNAWVTEMRKWQAWLPILDDYDTDERWDLRIEFVDPIAHRCMLEPSAMRDRFSSALYFLLHHANLSTETGYRDELEADRSEIAALKNGKSKPRYLLRSRLNEEITKLSFRGGWRTADSVIEKLQLLDDETLRMETLNYRNAASHSIAPRFEMGVIPFVKRQYKPADSYAFRGDGASAEPVGQNGFVLSYAYGDHDPLQHAPTFRLMRTQLKITRDTLCAYEALLLEVFERINAKNGAADGAN
ncbi:hypothetical protein [Acidovorax sp. M2(2025)]|uniref:hypothetical protein n=1 Tax=Acidovorax sp. M2(2025) TaxID=3411355 RepID=UPI003BF4C738